MVEKVKIILIHIEIVLIIVTKQPYKNNKSNLSIHNNSSITILLTIHLSLK